MCTMCTHFLINKYFESLELLLLVFLSGFPAYPMSVSLRGLFSWSYSYQQHTEFS